MDGIYASKWPFFAPGEIEPAGWLKRQLQVQAEGLSGHLDKVWPDVRDSAWIGGDREGWERVPYWLDGFIPLAYLLRDEDLIGRARRYVEAIMASQQPDGWICPCKKEKRDRYDVWAVFIICKALMVYGQCSGDERARRAVCRAMKNLESHVAGATLFNWGQSRWFEAMLPLQWLYAEQPETWMKELAVTLASQGLSYERVFDCWFDGEPDGHGVWRQQTHIVNLMMALKSEAVFSGLSGQDPNAFASRMYGLMEKHHGTPVGTVQGDECLAGRSPVRGTELCAVVEEMFSCEVLASVTGNAFWLDLLEKLAFNALPATLSADMWTHQYLQQLNQISCAAQQQPTLFATDGPQSNLFGLEPNFGCCTANFSQGWPKLALSAFLRTEKGILSAVLTPGSVHTQMNGQKVSVTLDTQYPFRSLLRYTVHCPAPVSFELAVRIPAFVDGAEVNGCGAAPGTLWREEKVWQDGDTVEVRLQMRPCLKEWDNGMKYLQRGPLVYALPVPGRAFPWEYERNGVERKAPYCDYTILPEGAWNYAFAGGNMRVVETEVGNYPFSRQTPPVTIEMDMRQVTWPCYPGQPGVCAEMPAEDPAGPAEKKTLYPYGCTTLRMTLMPERHG